MKKLALIFALPLLCGGSFTAVASDTVDFYEIEVAGIRFSDDKDRVKELLGEPRESGPTCDDCIDIMDSWFIYDGIRVHFLQGEVMQIEVSSEHYRLSGDVGVGDSKNEVVQQYGEPETAPHNEDIVLSYPLTRSGRRNSYLKLKFLIRENSVVAFQAGATLYDSTF